MIKMERLLFFLAMVSQKKVTDRLYNFKWGKNLEEPIKIRGAFWTEINANNEAACLWH